MTTPNVLEMETSPETANYRKSRLEIWAQIHKKRDDYRASALKHGATKPQADEAAGRDARSEVRWLVGELLTHAPGEHAAAFITSSPARVGPARRDPARRRPHRPRPHRPRLPRHDLGRQGSTP
jgi:hypothetical protein